MSTKRIKGKGAGQRFRLSKARLDELVEDALVDAYGESEQVTAFYTMMENDLRCKRPMNPSSQALPVAA